MQQGDFIRPLGCSRRRARAPGWRSAGAAITGHLGSTTTIQQIVPATSQAASALPTAGSALSVEQIYRLDAPGVVQINTRRPRRHRSPRASAPGFVIDKAGHIVTSNRIISGARSVKVSFSGNEELNATRRRRSTRRPTSPCSRSTTHSRSLSPLPLGDSDLVQVGDPVVAIGNTLALSAHRHRRHRQRRPARRST